MLFSAQIAQVLRASLFITIQTNRVPVMLITARFPGGDSLTAMLRGITSRTAVAISLMAILVLSVGTCVVPARATTHSCCMHMNMPCEGKADCCKASPQVPPASVTPLFAGFASMDVAEDFLSANNSWTREAAIAQIVPSQSPPPGIFSLRI